MNRFVIVAIAVLGACSAVDVRAGQGDSPAAESEASASSARSQQALQASVLPRGAAAVSPLTCVGTGDWEGCRGNGCAVCDELVSGAVCYFANHPDCSPNFTCAGQYFPCNTACPAPSDADFDCSSCGACCGNGVCDANEDCVSCPTDCPGGTCGDGSPCCGNHGCDDGSSCQ